MATQTELLERQEVATNELEVLKGLFHQFLNGPANASVVTEAGTIPTLSGLIEEVRLRVGQRRNPINYSVFELLRYEEQAEPMFMLVTDVPLWFTADLLNSYFRLGTAPSGAEVKFNLNINGTVYVITFAAGSTVGTVAALGAAIAVPAGSVITLSLAGPSYAAKGFAMTLVGLVEAPTP
ncbi:hypothetical protein [Xanthomonas phage RTH11]|nr:hypothetical protein [Xanthomonas phage RTH11]